MFEKLGGRKTVAFIISFITGVTLACLGKLTSEASNFIVLLLVAYVSGNLGEHVTDVIKGRINQIK